MVAFDATLVGCQNLLRSTFEDWLFLGLKLGHEIPVLSGNDLNGEPVREPLDTHVAAEHSSADSCLMPGFLWREGVSPSMRR